jgi:hypothetical protein
VCEDRVRVAWEVPVPVEPVDALVPSIEWTLEEVEVGRGLPCGLFSSGPDEVAVQL